MITHQIKPGTPEWLAYRAQNFNASDAPAMFGCSPYKTRRQLMHELATGKAPEVDTATQRRFDEGHRIEALARPLAEKIIGEDLYPVVGSEGEYSASFDGLTMAEVTGFEHKTMNGDLRAAFSEMEMYSEIDKSSLLPPQYRVQMEHQHMVSGCVKTLFMASKWDGDTLIEEQHCWYYSDMKLRRKIIAGWAQFKADLAAYVPPEVIVAPVAAPQMGLPAVSITVNGSIALVDNLEKVGAALNAYIGRINKKPETDQDFADLELTVKNLKAFEESLAASESNALAQVDSVDAMRKTVALYQSIASTNRILVNNLVKAEKEKRRTAIVSDAVVELLTHVRKLNERLGKPYMPSITSDFQGVIKGLKSLDSMKDKVSTELARCKIEANATADRIQANLEVKGLMGYAFLFADIAGLCLKPTDDFQNTVAARITAHEAAEAAKEEATRERIRAEEQAKAEKETRAKLAAEQAQQAADELAVVRASQAPAPAPVTPPGPAPASVTFEDVASLMPAAVSQAMEWRPAAKPDTPPTLTLGEISNRLGFNVTSAFLGTLGYEATTLKAAKLYHSDDFPEICEAIKKHISEVQNQFEPVAD